MLDWLLGRKKWLFLHIPKSAGRWIQNVIPELNKSLGAELFEGINRHYMYRYAQDCGLNGSIDYGDLKKTFAKHRMSSLYTFCSIRDPFQWYLSFYIWSHAVDPDSFFQHSHVPRYYHTFEDFILAGEVTYIGAVRPHLNACNSYVRLASLKDDFRHLIETAFPEKAGAFDDSIFKKKAFNTLNSIPVEKARKSLENSDLKKRFAAYIENKETDCFYTEEMKEAIRQRDALVFHLLSLDSPLVHLDHKLADIVMA